MRKIAILPLLLSALSACSTVYYLRIQTKGGVPHTEALDKLAVFYQRIGCIPPSDLKTYWKQSFCCDQRHRDAALSGEPLPFWGFMGPGTACIEHRLVDDALDIRIWPAASDYDGQRWATQVARQIQEYIAEEMPTASIAVDEQREPDWR